MTLTTEFFKYIAVGLAVAVPIGPMSLLCIDRTLRHGFIAGAVFGSGIALADITYALIVGIGLASVQQWLGIYGQWLRLAGALIIIVLAMGMLRPRPQPSLQRVVPTTHWRALGLAYTLTMSNPQTILLFATVLAATALAIDTTQAMIFAAGVGVGSMGWWLLLTAGIKRIAHRLSAQTIARINRGMAVLLLLTALILIKSVILP